MKASVIEDTGGVENIQVKEVPDPEVGEKDVLVEVKASAVNHTDVWIRRGYEGDPPIITGIDVAGTVAETGAAVDQLEVGDRVVLYWNTTYCGTCEFCNDGETTLCREYGGLGVKVDGGHAEYISVKAKHAAAIPDELTFEEAAAMPSNFGTAWRALVTQADVGPSDDVLVFGASGAVGHAALQIAKHAGATVYACSSAEAEKLKKLGADHVIDYTERDVSAAVAELTGKRGVDVVFESVGGEQYKQAIQSLARGGRLVTIGATIGDADSAMVQHVFWKQLQVIGATGCTRGEFDDMLDAVFDGHIRPVVDEVIELDEIPTAHQRLEEGGVFGKIIVTP